MDNSSDRSRPEIVARQRIGWIRLIGVLGVEPRGSQGMWSAGQGADLDEVVGEDSVSGPIRAPPVVSIMVRSHP
jgi:hypothetical protein